MQNPTASFCTAIQSCKRANAAALTSAMVRRDKSEVIKVVADFQRRFG